jgi:hypothetical protein
MTGGDSDYVDLQNPPDAYGDAGGATDGYGSSQNAPSSYLGAMQKGPGATPPAKSSTAAPNTQRAPAPEDVVKSMVDTLSAIYIKKFSKKKVTLGPKVGRKIKVQLVADNDMKAALTQQAENVADGLLQAKLKFNPDWVITALTKYYKSIKEPYPSRLQTVDQNTQLTNEEKAAIFGLLKASLISEVRKDVAQTQGFFSIPKDAGDDGTIFVRAEFVDAADFGSQLAGTIAHELAHAYADEGWRDFLRDMFALEMLRTGALEEGMATHIERVIVLEWHKSQPPGTLIPLEGYRDQPEVAESAKLFIDNVGEDTALIAFFGGWVKFSDEKSAQNTILLGKRGEKKWKWPWQK